MAGKRRLHKAYKRLDIQKANEITPIPGILGFPINGVNTVEVQNRPGYVYVRLRDNQSEVVQAFNTNVSPVYGLPVLIVRDKINKSRYSVLSRDLGRYENWGTSSPYLPRHGAQHSFDPSAIGGDIVWVYNRQFMPLNVYPSGSFGSMNALISPTTYYRDGLWHYAGSTGTASFAPYKPTGSSARMVLVTLDNADNPQLTPGVFFSSSLTGTNQIFSFIPQVPAPDNIPIAAIRLVSGTSIITWDNIYDVRPFFMASGFQFTGSSGHIIADEGTPVTNRPTLNFIGNSVSAQDDPANNRTNVTIDTGNAEVMGGRVKMNGNISGFLLVTAGNEEWIPWDIELIDDNNFFDGSTHITFPRTGWYQVNFSIHGSINSDLMFGYGKILTTIYKNGSQYLWSNYGIPSGTVSGVPFFIPWSFAIYATEDDYIETSVQADGADIIIRGVYNDANRTEGTEVSLVELTAVGGTQVGGGGSNALAIYNNNIFVVTGTAAVFNDNLTVTASGTFAYINAASLGGGSGASAFLDLTDTPDTYLGQSGTLVRVKDNQSGLEFKSLSWILGNSGYLDDLSDVQTTGKQDGYILKYHYSPGSPGPTVDQWEAAVNIFRNLADVPSTYIGQGGKAVTVKATEDGLEFTSSSGTATVAAPVPSDPYTFHDEFMWGGTGNNLIGELGWAINGNGAVALQVGTQDHPGWVAIRSGTANSNKESVTSSLGNTPILANQIDNAVFIFRQLAPSTGTFWRAGFGSDWTGVGNLGTDSVYLEFNAYSGTTMSFYTSNSGVRQSTILSGLSGTAGNWLQVEFRWSTGTNSVNCYVNGALKATHTTMPTVAVNAGMIIWNVTGGAQKEIDWDFFSLKTLPLGQRWT